MSKRILDFENITLINKYLQIINSEVKIIFHFMCILHHFYTKSIDIFRIILFLFTVRIMNYKEKKLPNTTPFSYQKSHCILCICHYPFTIIRSFNQ